MSLAWFRPNDSDEESAVFRRPHVVREGRIESQKMPDWRIDRFALHMPLDVPYMRSDVAKMSLRGDSPPARGVLRPTVGRSARSSRPPSRLSVDSGASEGRVSLPNGNATRGADLYQSIDATFVQWLRPDASGDRLRRWEVARSPASSPRSPQTGPRLFVSYGMTKVNLPSSCAQELRLPERWTRDTLRKGARDTCGPA